MSSVKRKEESKENVVYTCPHCAPKEIRPKPEIKVRELKVQYFCLEFRKHSVPRILLQGKWWREAGFSIADLVRVFVMDKSLVIQCLG